MFSQNVSIVKDKPKLLVPHIPVAVEQFVGKDFFKNAAGWIRNDLAALAMATSKSQYDAILQRLTENKGIYTVKDGESLGKAIQAIKPRSLQSPVELQAYAEYAAKLQLADIDAAYQDQRPDEKVSEDVSLEQKVD